MKIILTHTHVQEGMYPPVNSYVYAFDFRDYTFPTNDEFKAMVGQKFEDLIEEFKNNARGLTFGEEPDPVLSVSRLVYIRRLTAQTDFGRHRTDVFQMTELP